MMTGTPGRPGIAITGPVLWADAAPIDPRKTVSASTARIAYNPDRPVTLIQAWPARVKTSRQTDGKPNAQAFMLRQFASVRETKKVDRTADRSAGSACRTRRPDRGRSATPHRLHRPEQAFRLRVRASLSAPAAAPETPRHHS